MNYYNKIKEELLNNEIYKQVKEYSKNKNELEIYYNVGKMLIEAQGGEKRAKYGDNLIKEYSKKLVKEVNKFYNTTTLKRIRKFYLMIEKGATVWHLSWSHYRELLKFNDINEINYYIKTCGEQNLSVRKLQERINLKEYERLPESTKNRLNKKEENSIEDFIKYPIIIKSNDKEKITEKVLKNMILEDIPNFLEQLGNGYSFIKDEYPIKYKDKYNYIDILLFNIKYNCYVVVELKVTELKKEHIGQIEHYMNYIDTNLKTMYQNSTIGIIVTRENNEFVIKYCSNKNLFHTTYELV